MQRRRTLTKTNKTSNETSYYLSSLGAETTARRLGELIRGHWGAVENRTHWKKDALMGEDGTRSRNETLLANMTLIRSAILALHAERNEGRNMVEQAEEMSRRPSLSLRLIRAPCL